MRLLVGWRTPPWDFSRFTFLWLQRYETAMWPTLTERDGLSAQETQRYQQDHGNGTASISVFEYREEWSQPSGGIFVAYKSPSMIVNGQQ